MPIAHKQQKTAAPKTPRKSAAAKPASNATGAVKAPFPATVAPMLATLVDKPVNEPGWLYEIKWDGYRTIALMDKKEVKLLSRNNKSFHEKFYPIYEAVKNWGVHAVVDGEIAALGPDGISRFSLLQNWRSEADGPLVYYVFDLLWLNGFDLTAVPLMQRRNLLRAIIPANSNNIRLSENFSSSATDFLKAAQKMGMEGIIAKKADSLYHAGDRTSDWLKIKVHQRHEVVIGGYTQNEGSRKAFSSLLVGFYENGQLQYTGKIGTGFTARLQQELVARFKKLVVKKCPFSFVPDVNKPSRFRPNPPKASVTWLKPSLVCEVSYAEMTEDGVMRHPAFEGLREDKNAADVTREQPVPVAEAITASNGTDQLLIPVTGNERKTLLNPKEQTQVRQLKGHDMKFSNLHKIFWPEEKYTKRDVLNYYYQVAPYILPYLNDRPQSMNRFPNGITGKSFYQKDVTGQAPAWMEIFPYHTSDEKDKNYLVCTDETSLLYMANLGCIEMNPWNSTIHTPDNPDWCIIDIDPTEKNTFEQVIQIAQVTKQVLDGLKITAYCKTSGSTGLHIYIPLNAKYTYDECQLFGKWIATQVHEQLPAFTSIERMTNNRKGKVYIDYLQNRPKATLAAPYSLRPKPGAPVSMPVHWEEVKKGLQIKNFTLRNALERIKNEGDLFKPVLGKGINLAAILKKLS